MKLFPGLLLRFTKSIKLASIDGISRTIHTIFGVLVIKLQILYSSEIQYHHHNIFIYKKHRFICFNTDMARSRVSGGSTLIRRQWVSDLLWKIHADDGVMVVDLKISKKIIRIMVVYLLHSGYGRNYVQEILIDMER